MATQIIKKTSVYGGEVMESSQTLSGGKGIDWDESIPGPSTNLELVEFTIDVSALQGIAFLAEGGNVTLYFNEPSTGTPSLTKPLLDGKMFEWNNLSLITNPWGSTDVTHLYVTKAGAGAVRLRIKGVVDGTP